MRCCTADREANQDLEGLLVVGRSYLVFRIDVSKDGC